MHELGHVANGDIERAWDLSQQHAAAVEGVGPIEATLKARQLTEKYRTLEAEFAADEYAADKIGYDKAISGLRQILAAPNWLISKDGKKEIRKRIAHLELRRDRQRKEFKNKEANNDVVA